MRHFIIGISPKTSKIEETIDFLTEKKYPVQNVSIIMKEDDDTAKSYFQKLGLIDEVLASKENIPSIAVLGVGNLLMGGPLTALLNISGSDETYDPENTVTGNLAGGMVNAFMDVGIHEETAKKYEEALKAGDILIAVTAESEDEEAMLNKFFVDQKLADISYITE